MLAEERTKEEMKRKRNKDIFFTWVFNFAKQLRNTIVHNLLGQHICLEKLTNELNVCKSQIIETTSFVSYILA
jgi:hypothetical protein